MKFKIVFNNFIFNFNLMYQIKLQICSYINERYIKLVYYLLGIIIIVYNKINKGKLCIYLIKRKLSRESLSEKNESKMEYLNKCTTYKLISKTIFWLLKILKITLMNFLNILSVNYLLWKIKQN